jgi:SAM-dependent methyltransferase
MTASGFRDHFSGHAAEYRTFRPAYPPELFTWLAWISPNRSLAWDCGTGNGQAAIGLADHFERLIATDASPKQLEQAESHSRIQYAVSSAERCPLPGDCVDLVVAAQAIHWFNFDKFYAEVRRVCRPGGLLAITCYYEPSVNDAVDTVLGRYQEVVQPYWPKGREWVDAGYRTVPFPFEELATPNFELTLDSDLPRFLGYLGTWSATREFIKAKDFDPVAKMADEFARAWGSSDTVRTVGWKFNVRVGRVKATTCALQ